MKPATKAKAAAPGPYVPTRLLVPNEDEAKRLTPETLTRITFDGMSPIEQARERLVRANHRARLALIQIECFRRDFNVNTGCTGPTNAALRRLERLCDEAEADARLAQELWDRAVEELS